MNRQEKFRASEGKLRTANNSLLQERAILSPEAFAQRQQDFRKQVEALQRDMQVVNRLLDRALADGVQKIRLQARQITKELAEEKKLDLVLSDAAITYALPRLDLTDMVLSRLDKRLPMVKVALPPPPKAPADQKK